MKTPLFRLVHLSEVESVTVPLLRSELEQAKSELREVEKRLHYTKLLHQQELARYLPDKTPVEQRLREQIQEYEEKEHRYFREKIETYFSSFSIMFQVEICGLRGCAHN